jgi:hypothetical protein
VTEKTHPTDQPLSASQAAIARLVARAGREVAAVSAERTELSRLLADKELRRIATRDPQLTAQLTEVAASITVDEKSAAAWRKELGEASKEWEAALSELARVHGRGR